MSIKKFLSSRIFLINLLLAILLVVAILFIVMQSLNKYTRHGESSPVPNFTGLSQEEAIKVAKAHNLKAIVIDSVFTDKVDPGEVIEQVPEEGFGVKSNRTILLTINSNNKEKVALPKLTNISFRQALVLIENYGLKVGEISYQPSEYNNLVLSVKQGKVEVEQGDLLLKGSLIDFVVGRDSRNESTPLPNLTGLKIEDARNRLTDAMLNLGVLIYDESITSAEDTINATVWRQRPDSRPGGTIKLGASVDLWITVDENKLNNSEEPEI